MRAYVKVIYSSEGGSPAEIERVLRDKGFRKSKGTSVFEIELEEDDLASRIEDLHHSLRGLEVRYAPSLRAPSEVAAQAGTGSREKLEGLRPLGVDVDGLIEILKKNPEEFKDRALEVLRVHLGRIADEMERELREEEARRRLEEARERLLQEVRGSDGRTFQELSGALEIDPTLLSEMLDEMVERGMIAPEQRGRKVVFRSV